jgi:hypothetical protein
LEQFNIENVQLLRKDVPAILAVSLAQAGFACRKATNSNVKCSRADELTYAVNSGRGAAKLICPGARTQANNNDALCRINNL